VRRRVTCGPNRLERVRRRPLALRFLEQLWGFFAVLLWIAAACAFIAGLAQLAWAIVVVVVVNGTFSFLQEFRAERAIEALERLLPHTIAVSRDGVQARVEVGDLVPGDVVRLEEGDQVPADGQLLAAAGLRVDESALTGEPRAVFKGPVLGDERERVPHGERSELVFAGTAVVAGTASFVVTATGMTTEIGAIAELTQAVTEEPSPLQREMGRVTHRHRAGGRVRATFFVPAATGKPALRKVSSSRSASSSPTSPRACCRRSRSRWRLPDEGWRSAMRYSRRSRARRRWAVRA
jgi:magnesium-transporting ATPase (P-type)